MKVQISINDDLLKRIDEYADNAYTTRSGVITLATSQFLNSAEVVFAVKDMALSMRKLADSGVVDEETQKKLEDFERLSSMLFSKN